MENLSDIDANPSESDDGSLFMDHVIGDDLSLLGIDLLLREAFGREKEGE